MTYLLIHQMSFHIWYMSTCQTSHLRAKTEGETINTNSKKVLIVLGGLSAVPQYMNPLYLSCQVLVRQPSICLIFVLISNRDKQAITNQCCSLSQMITVVFHRQLVVRKLLIQSIPRQQITVDYAKKQHLVLSAIMGTSIWFCEFSCSALSVSYTGMEEKIVHK